MKCQDVKKQINEILDGKILDDKAVISHIQTCAACAKEYKAVKALKTALVFNEKAEIPADFNAGVWKKIGKPSPSLLDRVFGLRPNTAFVFKTAAAMAAIVFMVVMAKNTFIKNESVAALSPQAQVKTVVAKVVKKVSPAKALPCPEEKQAAPVEAAINNVPENIAAANKAVNKPEEGEPSTGRGPDAVADKAVIKTDKTKGAPAVLKETQPDSGMSAASISKNPEAGNTKEEVLNGTVEIRHNVFNPAQGGKMSLKYQVKTLSQVIVQVYNKKGEPIRTVFKGSRQPGIYEDTWDGTCDNGRQAPAEVYIIYIKTDLVEKRIKAAVVK